MESPTLAWESVYCLRPYNPHKLDGVKNPAFDRDLDGRLLGFKDGQYYAIRDETKVFRTALAELTFPQATVLAIIPSHRSATTNADQPLAQVAHRIAGNESRFRLRVDCLLRTASIPRLASGGERTIDMHLRSMVVTADVNKATIVLLDDVVTTEHSIAAARQLLTSAGAAQVAAIALARTVRYSKR